MHIFLSSGNGSERLRFLILESMELYDVIAGPHQWKCEGLGRENYYLFFLGGGTGIFFCSPDIPGVEVRKNNKTQVCGGEKY
jgi:hypothetical protein